MRQFQTDIARRRAFADHDVQREVFHRRIQHFLDRAPQAMNLVDEEHIACFEIGQNRGQIAGSLDGRAGRDAHVDAHLVRHDVRQAGLAQSRRTVKQDVIQRLAALPGGLNQDAQIFFQAFLAGKFGEPDVGRKARSSAVSSSRD